MVRFEWDPVKARANEYKHGVSFALAQQVFDDPHALISKDRFRDGEERWQTLGLVNGLLLLLVAHAYYEDVEGEVIRIISARSATQRKKVRELAARSDADIDYSDIPPLGEKFFQNAVRNPFFRPVKQQLTVRLDADVVAWLRQTGKGYQTRINLVLRNAMTKDMSPKSRPRAK
jgi:uncharacterized DUF497 family protein